MCNKIHIYDQKVKTKMKYLENEKSFSDDIKSIFHHFSRTFIETNKLFFWILSRCRVYDTERILKVQKSEGTFINIRHLAAWFISISEPHLSVNVGTLKVYTLLGK